MEKKGYYREFYPGYMGHIPYKYEVIGMTVGATNDHIKSLLRKEPDYEKTFVPSNRKDYTYYNKDYFSESMAKSYPLEEDTIFSNRSKMQELGFVVINMYYIQSISLDILAI